MADAFWNLSLSRETSHSFPFIQSKYKLKEEEGSRRGGREVLVKVIPSQLML
jgi:hypothetical protein